MRQGEDVAVDPRRVVGLEPDLDRGQRGRACRRRRSPASALAPGWSATAASIRPRTSAASASSSTAVGRVGGDVALGVADDAGLQRGVEGDLGRRCRRSARSSRRRCRRPASARWASCSAGGAEVGEARLLLAVEDAGREREALAQLGDEGARRWRRRGRRWSRSRRPSRRPAPRQIADVVGDRLAGRLDRLGGELPGEVDAPAQPRHPALPLDLASPARRRRRRPAAASSWCRCRSPRPCESPSPWPAAL